MAKLTDDEIRMIISLDAKGAQGKINKLEVAIHNLEKDNKNLTCSIAETEQRWLYRTSADLKNSRATRGVIQMDNTKTNTPAARLDFLPK